MFDSADLAYKRIGTPIEAHAINDAEGYYSLAAALRQKALTMHPARTWPELRVNVATPVAVINAGRWVIECTCGNCPSASPDWSLAICLECFYIYTSIVFPTDRAEIETALMRRPIMRNRNWLSTEILDDLLAENREHGLTE